MVFRPKHATLWTKTRLTGRKGNVSWEPSTTKNWPNSIGTEYFHAWEPPFSRFRATLFAYYHAWEPPLNIVCKIPFAIHCVFFVSLGHVFVNFPFSMPQHGLPWRKCRAGRYAVASKEEVSFNAPGLANGQKRRFPQFWLKPCLNPHLVCSMLSRLKNTGWLSSVKTVALKRENTHSIPLSVRRAA
jgi:hypothetical protein